MSCLKGLKTSQELEDYIFENDVDLRHKGSDLSVMLVEPTEENEEMSVVMSDG